MEKKLSKYKKGSKEYKAAAVKMKMLKWKLKHAKRAKIVKTVVKKGGKRAMKYAKKEKAKAAKLAAKLAVQVAARKVAIAKLRKRTATLRKRTATYRKGSGKYQMAMLKAAALIKKLKRKLLVANNAHAVSKGTKKLLMKSGKRERKFA